MMDLSRPKRPSEFTLDTVAGRDAIADQIKADIDEYCALKFNEGPRHHLGISEIGHNCARFLWYKFRWFFHEVFDGRMHRLFLRGHREEELILGYLRGIGIEVKAVQAKVVRSVGGHFGGTSDSIAMLPARYNCQDIAILLEFKTASYKYFQQILPMGVIKAMPKHYAQMCVYGKKHELRYGLYICVGKNDDDLDVELLELDWELANEYERKAEYIVSSPVPPDRLSNNPSYWECRFCPAAPVCHYGAPPLKNCRSCRYCSPVEGGWHCGLYSQVIPKEFLIKGCDSWVKLA